LPVPKRRQSKARSRKRRSHDAIKAPGLVECRQCRQPKPAHVICPNCGYYAGRVVVEMEEA